MRIAVLLLLPLLLSAAPKKRLLIVAQEQGYRHESVSHALSVIERLGLESGDYETTLRTDTEVLTKRKLEYNAPNLDKFDALLLYTGGNIPMDDEQKASLLAFVRDDGKGLVAVHSASITWTNWPAYVDMIGGTYDEHPWNTFDAPILVEDPSFPGLAAWPAAFTLRDEIYQMKAFDRTKVRVLMRLDASKLDLSNPRVHRADRDFAVSWARSYGKGRVFFTTLGHPTEVWDRPEMRQMIHKSIRWALGLESADVTPRPLP